MINKLIKLSCLSLVIFNTTQAVPLAKQTHKRAYQAGETRAEKTYGNVEINEIVSVYDGDTFKVNVKDFPAIIGDEINIRIYGVDTPEIKSTNATEKEKAKKAKAYLQTRLLEGKKVELRELRRDKYFRLLAEVYVDNSSIAEELIAAGLGKAYFGGTKE